MLRRFFLMVFGAATGLAVTSLPAPAADDVETKVQVCAACHGQNGKGDGSVSAELRTKPSDLTLIAKRNGGVFPTEVLYQIIDGRRTIRAYGTYEMPVWGSVFQSSGPENVARNRILAIIDYLKSIQLK